MSQWSLRKVPEACRDLVSCAYATEVTPMTLSPRARAFMAISTGRALRPESEMITRTSPARSGAGVEDGAREPVDALQGGAERGRA